MYMVLALGFSLSWGPQTYMVTTELPALRLRDMTLQLGLVTNVRLNFEVNFITTNLTDEKYAGLISRVGLIFGVACVYAFVCVF